MKTKFRVGDKVWDDVHFPGVEGVVTDVNDCMTYPVRAKFITDGCYHFNEYMHSGQLYYNRRPTLSLVPYKFELPPQPEPCEFEKYERVLVRDPSHNDWKPGLFLRFDGHYYHICGTLGGYPQCRKWNEDLIGKVTES